MKNYALIFTLGLVTSLNSFAGVYSCTASRSLRACVGQQLKLIADTDAKYYELSVITNHAVPRDGECQGHSTSIQEAKGSLTYTIGGFDLASQSIFQRAYVDMDDETPNGLAILDLGLGQRRQRLELKCRQLGVE